MEIKPLSNGTAPMSASVDELRATVENISLSPLGTASVSCINYLLRKVFKENICYSSVEKELEGFSKFLSKNNNCDTRDCDP